MADNRHELRFNSAMPMSGLSRRIYVYWLLLLLPTLAVGAGALVLLRREQARLQERGAEADATRRAAVQARAQLIAESAALLLQEVQQGLLTTLGELPTESLDTALDELERSNPLVRATFRCRPDGQLLRPESGKIVSAEAAEFLRKFTRLLTAQPPWNAAMDSLDERSAPSPAGLLSTGPSIAQQRMNSNTVQFQNAREEARRTAQVSRADELPLGTNTATREKKTTLRMADRSGWVPWFADNHLHVLGWLQPGGSGEVRGVELELTALISRLSATLPAEVNRGERYALRDDGGRVLHEVGEAGAGTTAKPVERLALSTALPHWEIAGWADASNSSFAGGSAWFAFSIGLVGVALFAILAGGSLLLWQARRAEMEAAQKTSFVANVSHEFKTPLTTIRLYTELLAQGRVAEATKKTEYFQTIGRETQRLARLVNNVLDFSRLEQGKKKYQREAIDLVETLNALLDAQAPRLSEAGLTLQRSLPSTPVNVTTDRDAFEQIVLNLLDNACKYASAGGEVTVELPRWAESGARLLVLDRGPGVPVAQHERIFEKFHRVDETLTAEKTGAGLGLSIARQLARGLGGDLRCETREGGGAMFVLEIA